MINDYCQWNGRRYIIKQAQEVTLKKQTSFKSINISYNLVFLLFAIMLYFYFCNHYYNVICIRYEKIWDSPPPAGLPPPLASRLGARPPFGGARARSKQEWFYHNCIILKISNYASLRFFFSLLLLSFN